MTYIANICNQAIKFKTFLKYLVVGLINTIVGYGIIFFLMYIDQTAKSLRQFMA